MTEKLLSISKLSKLLLGEIIVNSSLLYSPNKVSTDTRKDCRKRIFFCFKGERFNAHQFIENAIKKDVSCLVLDEEIPKELITKIKEKNIGLIQVKDSRKAHFLLAKYHFKQHQEHFKSIALTGSVGKTSLCHSLKVIMAGYFLEETLLATKGTTNNIIGIAKNIFRINEKTRLIILEIGTSSKGEIPFFMEHLSFDFTYINNIYKSHIGNFNSFDELREEKLSLINRESNPKSIHFLPKNLIEKYKNFISKEKSILSVDRIKIEILKSDLSACQFYIIWGNKEKSPLLDIRLLLKEQVQNLRFAFTLIEFLKLDKRILYNEIKNIRPIKQRMEPLKKGGLLILNDCYNASLESFSSALNFLENISPNVSLLLLVLGDIEELGKESEETHRKLVDTIDKCTLKNFFILVKGKHLTKALKDSKLQYFSSNNYDELIKKIKKLSERNTLIYLKGSRVQGLEKLINGL